MADTERMARQFEAEAIRCDKAARHYKANSGRSDLWNQGAAGAWRRAASQLRAEVQTTQKAGADE